MPIKKSRDELQEIFKQGARPTGGDFADFIESVVNVKDDGIGRPVQGNPLRIVAQDGDQYLLDLADHADKLVWRIKLTPDGENLGLDVSNTSGKSLLFLANESGNVGIGTNSPVATLHVHGTVEGIPIVDFQQVEWSFEKQKGGPIEMEVIARFPQTVIKADAMLGGWELHFERKQHVKAIGVEIASVTIVDTLVHVIIRCSLRDATGYFDDYFGGSGQVIVIARMNHSVRNF